MGHCRGSIVMLMPYTRRMQPVSNKKIAEMSRRATGDWPTTTDKTFFNFYVKSALLAA